MVAFLRGPRCSIRDLSLATPDVLRGTRARIPIRTHNLSCPKVTLLLHTLHHQQRRNTTTLTFYYDLFKMAPIQFGVLLIPFQILDVVGPVDILASASLPYLKDSEEFPREPLPFADRGLDIEFHYIGATMDGIVGTSNCTIKPTTTCATCPKLDYLLIGGPYPSFFLNVPDVFANFIRERVDGLEGLFTTCTGAMVAATVGVLDGKTATTNHQYLELAKKQKPEVNWSSKQWVADGKFWTAGGAVAGMDMFAHWVTEKCGREVAETAYMALDFEPRDVNGKPVPLKMSLRGNN
ncbi:hypothetical protein V494_05447 [Pseudogymnoascus sp. VKM F-4513 (FW-928)]|nr:hypothetical protein V494_05447 [Pseudogymnoascus sp. VKM F-4513 (FW-928)]